MFSTSARNRYIERGRGPAALLGFFADSLRESVAAARVRRDLVRALARTAAWTSLAVVLALLPVYPRPGSGGYLVLAGATLVASAVLTGWSALFSGLFEDLDGRPVSAPGPANHLTLVRFCLIAPVVVLLVQGRNIAALAVYAVLALTDVVDGIVARRRGPRTRWGVVMDPLADVFSTAAVFFALYARGFVPGWLVGLLALRYAMLILGSVILFLAVGPFEFRATLPGKVVGVLQALGAGVLVVVGAARPCALASVGEGLYPFLGLCFATVVVSQATIGLRWIRTRRAGAR